MKKKTVSFDFDDTLSEQDVQDYARELVEKGYQVMIHTQRPPNFNKDVFEVARRVGITIDNIVFCGVQRKEWFLEDQELLFHLDNDPDVYYRNLIVYQDGWKEKCERATDS